MKRGFTGEAADNCEAKQGVGWGMKALLVGMEWFPNRAGGLNRYFYEEVHALPTVGIGGSALVTAFRSGQSAPLALRAMADEGANGRQRRYGARREVRAALGEGVDVINAHFALYAYPWLCDLPTAMPLVVNFQGPWADEMAAEASGMRARLRVALARRIEKRVYARADRLITLSHAFSTLVQERYGVLSERVRVVSGGVDTTPYLAAPTRNDARARLGWPADRPILLAVRRLARRMGLENLLDAMATVTRAQPDALLFIGGKGAIAEELQARIERLNLTRNVRMLGFVPDADLPLAYAAATLCVVPTVALEGFGLVTVEALASGTPVLGTPVGGTPEILRGLDPALVFADATQEAIAERLLAALSGDMELPDSAACRAYAARYDWSVIAPQIRGVFEEALQTREGHSRH